MREHSASVAERQGSLSLDLGSRGFVGIGDV